MKVIYPIKLIITLVSLSEDLESFHSEAGMQTSQKRAHPCFSTISSADKEEDAVSDSQAHCFSQLLYDKYHLPLLGLICR